MNLVVLKGNLARDPEVREIETSGGRKTKVANFTIAVSRYFTRANGDKDKDTTFVPCEAWDTGAESIEKLLKKGDPVLVSGALKIETWDTDGVKHSKTKVRVSNFDKLYRAPKREESEVEEANEAPASTNEPAQKPNIPF